MIRTLLLAASTLALGACASVGADTYRPGTPPPAAEGGFIAGADGAFVADEPPGRWWSLLGDPLADRLVSEALAANTDLRVAAANLARARAVLNESRAGRLPTTDISASAGYGRPSGQALGLSGRAPAGETYDVGLDVGYQVDLFGRVSSAIAASRADLEAVQAAYDLARITVAAETVRAYADVCGANRQLAVARESLRVQEQTFDLTRRLLEGGRGTALETGQAGALLEQTRAAIPALEAERQAALFRLALLIGRPAADFPAEAAGCARLPTLGQPVPIGDGASLLARRPDIRAAERSLAAAAARVGVATADLYPTIALGGSIGSTATSLDGLGSSSAFRFSLGPLISWSFPNVAVARARIAQAEAGAEGALAQYDGAWLAALSETESALARYAGELDRRAALSRGVAEAREAARIARLRYEAGREGFQIVLEAERALAQVEAALAQSEAALSNNLVTVFLALGGGWQE